MNILSRVTRAMSTVSPPRPSVPYILPAQDAPPAEMYRVLRAAYAQNGLYNALAVALNQQGVWQEALRPLRNPAFRCVEFYASVLWPGPLDDALPIQSDNEAIIAPIQRVWAWSNLGARKQVMARYMALYGDLFIKVASRPALLGQDARVYLQVLQPEFVTDVELDERGFVVYARLDVPKAERQDDGKIVSRTHTEVWDKARNRYRRWEHQKDAQTPLDRLGIAADDQAISDFGIDFAPIVHAPFRDVGEDRGIGCFTLHLDKIQEADRQATRLAQMLFRNNKAVWALQANAADKDGRPLPPPTLTQDGQTVADTDTVTLEDEGIIRLPGHSTLVPLVPDIKYGDALAILNATITELEQDMPELAYYRITERSDLSGRALQLMLAPALKRVEEARGNAHDALARADMMALTIGEKMGLFPDLAGTFDNGGFAHTFGCPDVLPVDALERATTRKMEADAEAVLLTENIIDRTQAGADLGYSEQQMAAMQQRRDSLDIVPTVRQ